LKETSINTTKFKKTVFIVNPQSGKLGGKHGIISTVKRIWGDAARDFEVIATTRRGEGERLAESAVENGCDLVVAVGGDGTLNEIVRGVMGSDTCAGLVPSGSGNGFARQWDIPLNYEEACRGLLTPEVSPCDVGMADDHLFLVTFGCGLDTLISEWYARSKIRGICSYFYHGVRAFFSYHPEEHTVSAGGETLYKGKPLLLTVANAAGYGGGTVIAPSAKCDDGILDLCIVEPLSLKATLINLPKIFDGGIQNIPQYWHYPIREITIHRNRRGPIHVDGDPFDAEKEISVKVIPSAIKIALPAR